MTPEQLAYIQRRRRQIRYWPFVAVLLLLLLLACYGFLWVKYPLYVSPVALADLLREEKPNIGQLAMLAALGNLAFIGCGVFIAALIGIASMALYNEHRLIRLLEPYFPPAQTSAFGAGRSGKEQSGKEQPGEEPPAGHG